MTPEPITAQPLPRPAAAPLGVGLSDVVFVHWACEPDVVGRLLPPRTRPDTFDGAAYVGLVAFGMRSYGRFLELNVRTYSVDERGRRAVVFLTMEADRLPWVLAARAGTLPYRWARMSVTRDGDLIGYRSRRRWRGPGGPGARIRIRVGESVDGDPLDHFLTARWRLHHRLPGLTVAASLWHERWPLHRAELVELHEDLVAATGLPAPAGPPASVLYSPGVSGRLGLPMPA